MSKRHSASIALSMLALAALCGCQPTDLIHNALIDRWCGDRPCDWEVKGKIERVGTWHDKDYAVRFVSDHAQISQLNSTADADNAECYAFTMLAKVEHGARLFLELDFQDDGKIDFSQRIPESDWDHRQFLITPPTWYQGVRFILRKDGPGYAALAQLSAQTSHDCTAQPIDLRGRPVLAPCENDEQCSIGSCSGTGHCDGCVHDTDCGENICGVMQGDGGVAMGCVLEGSAAFAKRCKTDAQCESGICCNGACSSCCDGHPCPGDQVCDVPAVQNGSGTYVDLPKLCAPGQKLGAAGDVCTDNLDCKSGACAGADNECAVSCDPCWFCTSFRLVGGTCE